MPSSKWARRAPSATASVHESNCRGASPTPSARLIDLRAGEGVYFDGVDDYVELDNVELGGPMTISLWVKWEAITDAGHLFDFGNGDTNNNIKIKNDQTTNTLQLEITQGIDSAATTKTVEASNFRRLEALRPGPHRAPRTDLRQGLPARAPPARARVSHCRFVGTRRLLLRRHRGTRPPPAQSGD